MSSEAITRNDLTAILNEVLPPTPSEYRKLLWTNSSPTSSFAAQTISLDLSDYDEIEVEYRDMSDANHSDKMPQIKARVGERGLMGATFGSAGADYGSGSIYSVTRRFAIGLSGITFDDGHGAVASGSFSARNDVCVPLRIYGIQYDYVAPPQAEIADYVVEQGTSGIWTYRKWNSGNAECWGEATTNTPTLNSWGGWYYVTIAGENYPTGLFTSVISVVGQVASGFDFVSSIRNQTHGEYVLSTTTAPDILGVRPSSVTTSPCTGIWYAIGTWK